MYKKNNLLRYRKNKFKKLSKTNSYSSDVLKEFNNLLNTLKKLRNPVSGCPWDLKQSNKTLKDDLIEETYEVVEAIVKNNKNDMEEELGDLFFLVTMHCLVAEQNNILKINDVIKKINLKLIRRHPHIFGSINFDSVNEVLENWEKTKQKEKRDNNIIDNIPMSLPALQRLYRIYNKFYRIKGIETLNSEKNLKKNISTKLKQLKEKDNNSFAEILDELVKLAMKLKIKPESTLQEYISKNIVNKIKKEL